MPTAAPTARLAPDDEGLSTAADLLRTGRLVAFPTETVYGLGADATNGEAVAAIFEAKGRPSFNPLIVHVPDIETARTLVVFHPKAEHLAKAFWPGPLTLVLPRRKDCPVSDLVSAGLPTLAVRVPAAPVALALLSKAGVPVAAPSANRSGGVSPTTAGHVLKDLNGRIDAVLDGGPAAVGLESTVIGFDGDDAVLLRPGGLAAEEIEALIGPLASHQDPERPSSPGQLLSHYAPSASLRLNISEPEQGEGFLAFGASNHTSGPMRNLSPSGDLREAAANLFAFLRALDEDGVTRIAVAPIPMEGLGVAINDRLQRAAEPR